MCPTPKCFVKEHSSVKEYQVFTNFGLLRIIQYEKVWNRHKTFTLRDLFI